MIIPTGADIRTGLFHLLRNDTSVQAWALQSGFDLGGTRFREWQPFAPFLDYGVLISVDPVMELTPGESCRSRWYTVNFTLYAQFGGAGSTSASEWLGVLESALDDKDVSTTGVSGQVVLLTDIEFASRGTQTRHEEGWVLTSNFTTKACYA